ncbi:LysR family transcriptional regulator [Sphaerisporangium sp. B11E5]|uniref:LysR family transcriptional regulator n=1 Tax=Sphaerisporangium sp. B11E5 TaxID=3153563 RepID=UPI00325D03F3
MERREIEIFLTLAEELHFGRTADRLGVSVARVSQTVKRLERRIGAPLFERTSRRVALTPIGSRLHDDLRPAWRCVLEGIERAVAAGRGVEGVLRAGFVGTGVGRFLLQVAETFQAGYPGCQVLIREARYSDALALVRAGEVDVLLAAAPVDEPDLEAGEVLFREPSALAVAARHPFARRASVSMEDLAREPVLRPGEVPGYLDRSVVPARTPGGLPIERGPGFGTVQEMLALVGAGRGVFPVPAHAARYDARPDVAYVPLEDGPPYEWRLIWRATARTARVRAFCRAARDFAARDADPLLGPAGSARPAGGEARARRPSPGS